MADKDETFFTLDGIVNSVYEGDCLEYMRQVLSTPCTKGTVWNI